MWGEIYGEKPFEWRETLLMERNLSIGEKPFDWSHLKFLCYWHYEECWTQTVLHSSLAITAFITSKQSNFIISTKVKMKMQLRLTKFTFHLVGSNFIISTKVKMKMQLRIANLTFHLHLHCPRNVDSVIQRFITCIDFRWFMKRSLTTMSLVQCH